MIKISFLLLGLLFLVSCNNNVVCEQVFPYPPTYECREVYYNNYQNLINTIHEKEVELYYLKMKSQIMKADIQAIDDNLTVEYIELDNNYIVRVEYDGEFFEDVDISNLVYDLEVRVVE